VKNLIVKFIATAILAAGIPATALAKGSASASPSPMENIVKYFTVDAFDENSHSIYIKAGELVYIKATGNGNSDLDMYVYDSNEKLVVQDVRNTTDGYVTFTAGRSGDYYIDITNDGDLDNVYKLVVDLY
jgi:hypothetical protein